MRFAVPDLDAELDLCEPGLASEHAQHGAKGFGLQDLRRSRQRRTLSRSVPAARCAGLEGDPRDYKGQRRALAGIIIDLSVQSWQEMSCYVIVARVG